MPAPAFEPDARTQWHVGSGLVADRVEPDLAARPSRHDVPGARVVRSTRVRDLLSWFAPTLPSFGLRHVVIRRLAERQGGPGGFMGVGESRAEVRVERDTGVDVSDVAGVDEAKAELQEIVAFPKDAKGYGRLGARMPEGVLPVGPPGVRSWWIAPTRRAA